MISEVAPGDVLAVLKTNGAFSHLIRFAEYLQGKPDHVDHVVIVTHQDQLGRWMGIQGAPGGVGLTDCTPYLASPITRSNHGQPKPDSTGQLTTFLAGCAKSLEIAYDWVGVVEDALAALAVPNLSALIDPLWRWPTDRNLLPGHVVCSSLAAMLYDLPAVGWAHPDLGTERVCEPADWWAWSDQQKWMVPGG